MFNIYFVTDGGLSKLYEVNRNSSGLYFHAFGNRSHFTYHSDGKSWFRHPVLRNNPNFNTKRQRTPLNDFVGPESITSFNVLDFAAKSAKKYQVKPDDVVIDIKPPFCVEIILTSKETTLPELSERKNSQKFLKKDISPMIIIEAFNLVDRRLVEQRFRIRHPEIA